MKKTLLLIIAFVALATSCDPVTYDTFGGISGEVVDQETGAPVQQATVTLSPTGMNTYTGSDGTFEFIDLDERQYTVTVQKTGYITNRKTVTTIAGRVITIKLTMQQGN